MGLEAVVFCDCLERGKLKSPHPFPELVYVAPNGAPEIHSKNDREIEQHDDWMESACRHESMMIDGCRLGSAGGIEFSSRRPTPDRQKICAGFSCALEEGHLLRNAYW